MRLRRALSTTAARASSQTMNWGLSTRLVTTNQSTTVTAKSRLRSTSVRSSRPSLIARSRSHHQAAAAASIARATRSRALPSASPKPESISLVPKRWAIGGSSPVTTETASHGVAATDSICRPRSFWLVTKPKGWSKATAVRAATATMATAAATAERISRGRSHSPKRTRTGQSLTVAPRPASAPNQAGRRWMTSRAPTAITAGARSKRRIGSVASTGIPSSQTQTPVSRPPSCASRVTSQNPSRSKSSIRTTKETPKCPPPSRGISNSSAAPGGYCQVSSVGSAPSWAM